MGCKQLIECFGINVSILTRGLRLNFRLHCNFLNFSETPRNFRARSVDITKRQSLRKPGSSAQRPAFYRDRECPHGCLGWKSVIVIFVSFSFRSMGIETLDRANSG